MTFGSPKLLARVRSLNCVNCGAFGVQAAHANLQEFGKGMGIKASDAAIMALCQPCHFMLDQSGKMSKMESRQFQYEMIAKTLVKIFEAGEL